MKRKLTELKHKKKLLAATFLGSSRRILYARVSAFDAKDGIISAGLCGFDINYEINSIRTNLTYDEVKGKINKLIPALFSVKEV